MEQVKKDELILALEIEMLFLAKKELDTKDHEYSIHYLRTGEVNGTIPYYEILDGCVNNIDYIYQAYCT